MEVGTVSPGRVASSGRVLPAMTGAVAELHVPAAGAGAVAGAGAGAGVAMA